MSIIDTPYRAPADRALARPTHRRSTAHPKQAFNVAVGSGWIPEEFAASASHIFPRRHQNARETIEMMQGIWTNDVFEYHGEFADCEAGGFGAKPVQKPHPPIYFSGLKDVEGAANPIAKYAMAAWIGIQDSPEEIAQ